MLGIDLRQGVVDAWTDIITFVPKAIGFLLIVLVGWMVAQIVGRAVDAGLEKLGFDRWVERGGLQSAFERTPYDASGMVGALAKWTIVLLALQLGLGVFGPNPVSDAIDGVVGYLPDVFVAVFILVVTFGVARVVRDLLASALARVRGGGVLAAGAGLAIAVIGVFAALDQLQVAPAVVIGVFYAILAIVVGASVIAIGVGAIPVVRRWLERAAAPIEQTTRDLHQVAGERAAQEAAVRTQPVPTPPPPPDVRTMAGVGSSEADRSATDDLGRG